jgi:hypothetical protein
MVNWWDAVFITLNIWMGDVWNNIPAIADFAVELTLPTIQIIIDFLVGLALVMLYLPERLFGVLIDLLNVVIGSVAGLINTVITGGNTVISSFIGVFDGVMPSPWIALLGTIVIVNIVLRVYHYVKDISIAGFKI